MTLLDAGERNYNLTGYEGWSAPVDDPPRRRPPDVTLEALKAMTELQRLEHNERRAVWHANLGPYDTPEMLAVIDDIDTIVQANRQDGDRVRSSAVLDAYPGLGKTTLAVHYGRQFHRRQMALYGAQTRTGSDRIPVAYVRLAGRTTMRSVNAALCEFYGHPQAEQGTASVLGRRAAMCASATETRLIIVDDIHFLDTRSRDGREVANHFKYLANEFAATFLFVGVGIGERGLLTEGLGSGEIQFAQTARRWTRSTLRAFHLSDDAGRRVWRDLLLAIERDVVLAAKWQGMIANELGDYLYARSSGHFASLMALVARGCQRAITSGEERLTPALMDLVTNDAAAEAARQRLATALKNHRSRVGTSQA